jgi:hypothetical protein
VITFKEEGIMHVTIRRGWGRAGVVALMLFSLSLGSLGCEQAGEEGPPPAEEESPAAPSQTPEEEEKKQQNP